MLLHFGFIIIILCVVCLGFIMMVYERISLRKFVDLFKNVVFNVKMFILLGGILSIYCFSDFYLSVWLLLF